MISADPAPLPRRSHPGSVLLRLLCLPALVMAVYSHRYIGGLAVLPAVVVLGLLVIHPLLLPVPANASAWATRSVLGERQWRQLRQWNRPLVFGIVAGLCYLLALLSAFDGMLGESLLLTAITVALRVASLDGMARRYAEQPDATIQHNARR